MLFKRKLIFKLLLALIAVVTELTILKLEMWLT